VTGAAGGLGQAFALSLADAGASVAVCDIDPAVGKLRERGMWTCVADVSDPDAVRAFVDGAAAHLGGIDVLVNNAAVMRITSPATDSWERTLDDFSAVIDVNFRGPYLVGRAAIPYLVRAGGDIINITTDHVHTCGYPDALDHRDAPDCKWAGTRRPALGGAGYDVYDGSKWALKGLTNVWAQALAPHRVRVNSLGMGATDTQMFRSRLGDRPAPPGVMQPEQIAAVLVDLLAEGPSGRTGDTITLWAGHPCRLPPVGLEGMLAAQWANTPISSVG
jgi:NAD(P)-dependent dehydrogenase (short-subunit alcohol dehydrogenase family)